MSKKNPCSFGHRSQKEIGLSADNPRTEDDPFELSKTFKLFTLYSGYIDFQEFSRQIHIIKLFTLASQWGTFLWIDSSVNSFHLNYKQDNRIRLVKFSPNVTTSFILETLLFSKDECHTFGSFPIVSIRLLTFAIILTSKIKWVLAMFEVLKLICAVTAHIEHITAPALFFSFQHLLQTWFWEFPNSVHGTRGAHTAQLIAWWRIYSFTIPD